MLGKRGKVMTEALFCVHLINVTVSDSPQHNCYPGFDQAEGRMEARIPLFRTFPAR